MHTELFKTPAFNCMLCSVKFSLRSDRNCVEYGDKFGEPPTRSSLPAFHVTIKPFLLQQKVCIRFSIRRRNANWFLPERLVATVQSNKADADAFPWQRIKNQRRTLISSFRIQSHVAVAGHRGYGANSAGDVAGLDQRQRLWCPTCISLRTQHFTGTQCISYSHYNNANVWSVTTSGKRKDPGIKLQPITVHQVSDNVCSIHISLLATRSCRSGVRLGLYFGK